MKKYKGKPGWFKESERHRLARLGIKTKRGVAPKVTPIPMGGNVYNYPTYARDVREIKKATTYTDDEFEYTFSPVEDTIQVTKVADGYIVKYLAQDNDPESPDAWGDDSVFLVHYHRYFQVENKNIITEDDARDWYQGKKIEASKDYYIIPIEAYIHSGVSLAISQEGKFPDRRWDVSHVGLALISKKEFKSKKKAEEVARGLVECWNQYLSGDVYSIVVEKYDNNKQQVDYDVVGGYYSLENAKQEMKDFSYEGMGNQVRGQKKITDYAKYDVKAVAMDRISRKTLGKSRTERVDTKKNQLFKHARNSKDVESMYESFWNDLNPKSSEVVKVIGVKEVK